MDLVVFSVVSVVFTIYGYVWGRGNAKAGKKDIELIVSATMDNLEKEGFLKTKTVNGEIHYIKWNDELIEENSRD
jgi:hypothetical protein